MGCAVRPTRSAGTDAMRDSVVRGSCPGPRVFRSDPAMQGERSTRPLRDFYRWKPRRQHDSTAPNVVSRSLADNVGSAPRSTTDPMSKTSTRRAGGAVDHGGVVRSSGRPDGDSRGGSGGDAGHPPAGRSGQPLPCLRRGGFSYAVGSGLRAASSRSPSWSSCVGDRTRSEDRRTTSTASRPATRSRSPSSVCRCRTARPGLGTRSISPRSTIRAASEPNDWSVWKVGTARSCSEASGVRCRWRRVSRCWRSSTSRT